MSQSIRLGLMVPASGPLAIYGSEITWAAQIACSEINDQGGIYGQPLELMIEDDGHHPATAVGAGRRLINESGCVALIGNLLSPSVRAVAAQVAEPMRIPLLNFSFYESGIPEPYFFHFAAVPNQQLARTLPFMVERFGRRMFFAGNEDSWPHGSILAAKRALTAAHGEMAGEAYFAAAAPKTAFEALIARIRRVGADVLVCYFTPDEQAELLGQLARSGLKDRLTVLSGHFDEVLASRLPPNVRDGVYASHSYFMSLDSRENHTYLQRLARHPGVNGMWPQGNGMLTHYGEGAYVCVHAFASAVENAFSTQPDVLVKALEKIKFQGLQGPVAMNPATHHASVNIYLARCEQNGTFTVLERFGQIQPDIIRLTPDAAQTVLQGETPTDAQPPATEARPLRPESSSPALPFVATTLGILTTDCSGLINEANRSACRMFGYADNEMIGMPVQLLVPPELRQRLTGLIERFDAGDEAELHIASRDDIVGYRKEGGTFPLEASIGKFKENGEQGLIFSLQDTTERKKTEMELTRQATHDLLTGLPNRALIRERLNNALNRSRLNGLNTALLFIDLDDFKPVNEAHGYDVGDQLLKQVAKRLLELVRPGDSVARLTGDEFIVMCENIEQPGSISVLAERINEALSQPFAWNGIVMNVTASIGVAVGNGLSHTAVDLLRFADTAMYAVKEQGRNGWQFFSESMNDQAQQRLRLTNGLRMAIDRNEFSVCFQPIVATGSGRIVGAELLLRWRSAQEDISPSVFIPVAEITGIIIPLGAWVFRQACQAEVEWRYRWGKSAPYVSLNVSARQLSEVSLIDEFTEILAQTGADPRRLVLEITENSLIKDAETHASALQRLNLIGLRIAIDDFGTGYSSLSQLARLPCSLLKIDRTFIDGLTQSEENRTVVRAIIGLGRSLGFKLLAEGVENAEQSAELSAYGCDYQQGYFYHHPLTGQALIERVDSDLGTEDADHPDALHFLLYTSRTVEPMTDSALAELVKKARRYNRSAGLTGRLIHKDGYFMQLLEGKREILFALFDRIQADPRHRNPKIMIEGPLTHRLFTEWGLQLDDFSDKFNSPLIRQAQHRTITLEELAEDPQLCLILMAGQPGLGHYR